MSQAIDEGFARSEQLKQDWAKLREEINSIPPNAPDAGDRRAAIHSRMDDLMNQMAQVVTQTRQLLPNQSQTQNDSFFPSKPTKITSAPTPPTLSPPPSPPRIPSFTNSQSSVSKSNMSSPVQYSARRMHIIRRTYDSSDTESENSDPSPPSFTSLEKLRGQVGVTDNISLPNTPTTATGSLQNAGGVEELPDLPQDDISSNSRTNLVQSNQQDNHSDEDIRALREEMRHDADPNATTITVEGKKLRNGLGELRKGLRDKLRIADHTNRTSTTLSKTSPSDILRQKSNISPTECSKLSDEQNALERESKRLMRKPERTEEDNNRLELIAERLSRISSTLAEVVHENHHSEDDIHHENLPGSKGNEVKSKDSKYRGISMKKSMFGNRQTANDISGKPQRMVKTDRISKNTPTSPITDEDIDLTFEIVDEEEIVQTTSPDSSKHAPNTMSKRKKGWMALEAGVASIKAFGRTVRDSVAGNGNTDNQDKKQDNQHGRLGSREKTVNQGNEANVFTETTQRLQERGEKLNNTANDAEQMANDAEDMLAAVRALRQRKQKAGFFS